MNRPALPAQAPTVASLLATAATVMAAVAALALAAFSLRWPLVHDLPIFLYDGFLMQDLGRVPYRDFYEVNAPATLLFFAFVHQVTGGDALALRLLDLTVLSALSGVTVLALRAHGWKSGVLAASCFAIAYLAEGPVHSLQREYLSVLPLAASFLLVFRSPAPSSDWVSMAAVGVLGGLVASVKPVLIVCWAPLVTAALLARAREARQGGAWGGIVRAGLSVGLPFAAGLGIVQLVVLGWLLRQGALDDYLEIVRGYYPLYAQLKGNGMLWQGSLAEILQRYIAEPVELPSGFRFAVPAFAGLMLAWTYRDRPAFVHCLTLGAIACCALLYISLAGKFWVYHRFPLFWGLAMLAGLSVSREISRPPGVSAWQNGILCVALAAALPLTVAGRELLAWRSGKTFEVKGGRVDLVADYLRDHVGPGETVLPLDVTSGAIHALYRDRRPLYGRFIYDLQFYHHVGDPYIQGLRRELLAGFTDSQPDVVVRFDDTWLRTPDFPELDAVLDRDFELVLQENDVSIFRRRDAAQRAAVAAGFRSRNAK